MSELALLGGNPVFEKSHRWPSWPVSTPDDERRLLEVVRGGAWGLNSPVTAEFTKKLAEYLGVKHVLPVNSGTAALELVVKSLGIGPGDEVIVPAYTFVASATCVLEMGGTVVFADIDPATLTISPTEVARLITPRTKAVIAVHFGGNPCDMDGLNRVLSGKNIALIEDAAHAQGMRYRGLSSGKLGRAACFSYQSSKNMSCGEGGALATDETRLFEMAESFHSFGRKVGRPWYEHHELSWNHRLTALQSAMLIGQLDRLEEQTQRRYENAQFLNRAIAGLPGQRPQETPDRSPTTRRAFHIYIWRCDTEAIGVKRNTLTKALEAEGLPVYGGYLFPLQKNPMFQERRYWHHHRAGDTNPQPGEPDYRRVETPVTTAVCADAVWMSQTYLLGSRAEMQGVVDALTKVLDHADELRNAPEPANAS